MSRLWNYCAFCGKRIETGEMCYGLPDGKSVCTDCCVEENEGAAVSNDEEEQEDDNYTRKLYGRLVCKYGTCSGCILREDFFCANGERKEGAEC
jgi:hypothetical protein